MRVKATLLAGLCAGAFAIPAQAQSAGDSDLEDPQINSPTIIVTAQRQSQSLQEVPIAVSAFDAEALEAQQIENAADLQLTLPNVSFTKSNFTASSFTIRGIGDLCVGVTCDSATAIAAERPPSSKSSHHVTSTAPVREVSAVHSSGNVISSVGC